MNSDFSNLYRKEFLKGGVIMGRPWEVDASIVERVSEISIEEFEPELFDCEADGSCSSGHNHNPIDG